MGFVPTASPTPDVRKRLCLSVKAAFYSWDSARGTTPRTKRPLTAGHSRRRTSDGIAVGGDDRSFVLHRLLPNSTSTCAPRKWLPFPHFCYIQRMTAALRVEKVSKQYRIYERPGDRLKESLTRGLLRRHREFWALRDVDFEIESGATVGIVGPNGCGKSALLQIISGTLAPTHGDVWHEGRIAALLELGAGFDPEFTGVENVYMNASLLGLTRRETDVLFPAIERFAEIGKE